VTSLRPDCIGILDNLTTLRQHADLEFAAALQVSDDSVTVETGSASPEMTTSENSMSSLTVAQMIADEDKTFTPLW
jgi:hypothetical protein